jgi:branched-chain amino acid transport system substrate-binding protein
MKKILLLIAIIIAIIVWTSYSQLVKPKSEVLYIAFAGPVSNDPAGKGMVQAIRLYLDKYNRANEKSKNKRIELELFDDLNKCDSQAIQEAQRLVDENRVLAVIGHWYSTCSINGGKIYKKYGVPALAPGSVHKKVTDGNEWYFRTIYDDRVSGQFLAYHINKVLRLNNVSIILDEDSGDYASYLAEMFAFYARQLNMTVKYKWVFKSSENQNAGENYKQVVRQLEQNKKDAGAVLLSVYSNVGPQLVQLIKDSGIDNPIVSGSGLSEQAFISGFEKFPKEKTNPGYYTDDIYVATPLLFDTANEKAQQFKDEYQTKYQELPDWAAAYAYDTVMVLMKAMEQANLVGSPETLQADRKKIRDKLATFTNLHEAIEGTTGFNYFDVNRNGQKPVAIGVYKNNQLISSLTRFQVVRNPSEIADFEQALKDERILQFEDKYMHKVNVVYSGIKFNEITEFDPKTLTCTLDFHLWFRFQDPSSNPQEIEFLNSLEPDKIAEQLRNPVDEKTKGQIIYRAYRIKSRFRADFLSDRYAYKQHLVGFQFYHKYLNKDNIIYVTDVLGMGETKQVRETMQKTNVLSPTTGWMINNVRFFQDVAKRYSLGDPQYLNVQGGTIEYSQFNASIQLKKNELTLRGIIPYNYALNVVILAIICLILLLTLSKNYKRLAKYVLIIQAIVAFIFLLALEVYLLGDLIAQYFDTYSSMKVIPRIFDILWWIVPAYFVHAAAEKFMWIPIEEKTGRVIPNIVRLFLAFIIYFMAGVGIIAFVYEESLTSILATSGVIAMIIGLAIQINISNIFSGIAINIERPFRIGDWVKIGQFEEGEIVDITWRSTRLKTRAECILCIPNSTASESPILNFCYPDEVYWLWPTVYIHPMHSPVRVKKILLDALQSSDKILKDPEPVVILTGINEWAAGYWIAFCANNYANKFTILEDVWTRVWFHLNRAGITPAVQRQEVYLFKGIKERGGDEATKPITLLQEIDIFKPFSKDAKQFLSEKMRHHRYHAGDTIVKQGDVGNSLFIIVEGVVGVYIRTEDGKSKEVARLGAGNFFGEMALLTGEERTATVIAIVETHLFELTKEDIAPLIEEQPEVSELVSKVLTQRQMATQSKMHVVHVTEIEKEAVYKRFLNKIEKFFSSGNGTH